MAENWYDRRARLRDNLNAAEAAGEVADSLSVRMALVTKMNAGNMTLPEVQAELARIKRGAKKAGKITRAEAMQGKRA